MNIIISLEFTPSDNFVKKVKKVIENINPNIENFEILEFGLQEDVIEGTYRTELVVDIDNTEVMFTKTFNDIETYEWYVDTLMNQKFYKYVLDNIIDLIESDLPKFYEYEDEEEENYG